MYELVGRRVRVHLYDRNGITLGTVEGRVADYAPKVQVAAGMVKDLVYVVDIATGDETVPYRNSAGESHESWFAVQDVEAVDDDGPRLFRN